MLNTIEQNKIEETRVEEKRTFSGAIREIAGRKLAEEILQESYKLLEKRVDECTLALQESQRILSTLISNLPGMVYRCSHNQNWNLEFVNDGCLDLTGYHPEELIGTSLFQLIHPEDRDLFENEIQFAIKENRSFQLVYRIITASGQEKLVMEQSKIIVFPEGEEVAIEGFVTHITKYKKREVGDGTKQDYCFPRRRRDGNRRFVYKHHQVQKVRSW